MKQSTKKAIAVMVAATFPVWIVGALIALPVMFAGMIFGGVYDSVLGWLNHERPDGADL